MPSLLLIQSGFVIASLAVIGIFVTSTTYIQLGMAILLYPIVIFLAFKAFPRKASTHIFKKPVAEAQPQVIDLGEKVQPQVTSKIDGIGISDINKRTFLKIIGASGLSFFLLSIFSRKIETALFGQNSLQTQAPPQSNIPSPTASPTEGYSISEVDDNVVSYYGFINKTSAWFIMQGDTDTGSFRYVRGKSSFPDNWKKRQSFEYDYFSQTFP